MRWAGAPNQEAPIRDTEPRSTPAARRPPGWLAALLALCACGGVPEVSPEIPPPEAQRAPSRVASNVLRHDYAGSEACADCHPDVYDRWAESPMRRMTRAAGSDAIRAPFDGVRFEFRGDRAELGEVDGVRYLVLVRDGRAPVRYRITRVIGGRHREDYAGVAVGRNGEPRPGAVERIMPVSYVFDPGEWRYKGYSVMATERPGLRAGPVWRRTCIFCHNTVPHLVTAYDDLATGRVPTYQGSVSDRLLPPERRWTARVLDPAGLARAVAAEAGRLYPDDPLDVEAPLDDLLRQAIRATAARFDERDLVETGIGCEACHGGSRAHVDDPMVRPALGVRSDQYALGPPDAGSAAQTNRLCARCHTVLFSQYPHTWEGGGRKDPVPGGSTVNSGEARDLLLGGCADELSCTQCHDPHAHDDSAALRALATPAGNPVCTGCHPALAGDAAVRAHAHHDPQGSGGACVACHLPRKNLALDYRLTRYHRIGRPNDPARVERDRPLECALCHPDTAVEVLVETMERWWGRPADRGALRALYGEDLSVDAVTATLARGLPHEQATALGLLAERPRAGLRDAVVAQLANPYPLVRYFAREALAALTGARPPLDMNLEGPALVAAARAWLAANPLLERSP